MARKSEDGVPGDPSVGGGVLPCLCNLEVPAAHARDWQLRAACDALGVRLQAGMM